MKPLNCRCGGEAFAAKVYLGDCRIKCDRCLIEIPASSLEDAGEAWNRVMAEPKRVSVEEIARLLMRWDSILADKGLAEDIAHAIHELVYSSPGGDGKEKQ